jgi:hypothetical protein
MVNYHLQSNDNLIKTAVRMVIDCAKEELEEKLKAYEGISAIQRLTIILKEITDSFSCSPEICKIAILDNLLSDDGTAHILSDVEAFNRCIQELYADNKSKINIANYIIAGFLNYIFLKADVIKKETNLDFYVKEQRDIVVEHLVHDLLNRCDTK